MRNKNLQEIALGNYLRLLFMKRILYLYAVFQDNISIVIKLVVEG